MQFLNQEILYLLLSIIQCVILGYFYKDYIKNGRPKAETIAANQPLTLKNESNAPQIIHILCKIGALKCSVSLISSVAPTSRVKPCRHLTPAAPWAIVTPIIQSGHASNSTY